MKDRLVELSACPCCGGDLGLEEAERAADGVEVFRGRLVCQGCAHSYPISDGIPRLVPPEPGEEKRRTAAAFGSEWRHFDEMHPEYEAQFLSWIEPLTPSSFAGLRVLDAGCGMGRHAYWAARYGSREVIAMDLSEAVEPAHRLLGGMPNVHVVQADIYHPPFCLHEGVGEFDLIYSIGVLHHLPDPEAGFRSLVRYLAPGGQMVAWVYGRENNTIVHRFIDPLRRHVTSRMNPQALRVLCWPLALVLQATVKLLYGPLVRAGRGRGLPSRAYLASLAAFSFRQNHSIVFDHLVAPTAHYVAREEFEQWFTRAGLEDVHISWRNENSWRGLGRRSV